MAGVAIPGEFHIGHRLRRAIPSVQDLPGQPFGDGLASVVLYGSVATWTAGPEMSRRSPW